MEKPTRWDHDLFQHLLELLDELRGIHGGISSVEVLPSTSDGIAQVVVTVMTDKRL